MQQITPLSNNNNHCLTSIKQQVKLIGLLIIFTCMLSPTVATSWSEERPHIEASFAPGTPKDYVDHVTEQLHGSQQTHFNIGTRWYPYSTAHNSGGYVYGDGIVLTWSIMPDGTNMPGQMGDPSCSSSLIADMDAVYGAGNWVTELETIFAEWSIVSGIEYVYEPQDDGAPWPYTYGVAGVRGDIRIGGCYIDGNSGVLAYNFYPDSGDMKIDSSDSWFANSPLATGFHNVVAHENGHGIGISHVCPFDRTKLLEPWISQTFRGPQLDDVRAIQRLYGDAYENLGMGNDTAGTAANLGLSPDNIAQLVQSAGLDTNIDEDWYQFTVDESKQIDIALTPLGTIYEDSNQNGSCPPVGTGPFVDAAKIQDLGFELIDADGTTILYTGELVGLGETESVAAQVLGNSGTKYIRIFGEGNDDVQLYDLVFTVQPIAPLAPQIIVNPAVCDATLLTDQQITQTLTISNTGTADLIWDIGEYTSINSCDDPNNVAWMVLSQTNGTNIPGSDTAVEFTLDATGLAAGSYASTLCIGSNDPVAPQVQVALTLLVEEPVQPTAPTVTVTQNEADLSLAWLDEPAVITYEIHRDRLPYFTPQPETQQQGLQLNADIWTYIDSDIFNSLENAQFYFVRAIFPTGTADQHIGYFKFNLLPGN